MIRDSLRQSLLSRLKFSSALEYFPLIYNNSIQFLFPGFFSLKRRYCSLLPDITCSLTEKVACVSARRSADRAQYFHQPES